MSVELSDHQSDCLYRVLKLQREQPAVIVTGGAGTGKTAVLIELHEGHRNDLAVAMTHNALQNLRRRGFKGEQCTFASLTCQYNPGSVNFARLREVDAEIEVLKQSALPLTDPKGQSDENIKIHNRIDRLRRESAGLRAASFNRKSKIGRLCLDNGASPRLIFVDELSLVSERFFQLLQQAAAEANVPLVAFGDPYQLPPVGQADCWFGHGDVELLHVHRQAQDSAIIRAAHLAKDGESPLKAVDEREVFQLSKAKPNFPAWEHPIYVRPFNAEVVTYNQHVRRANGLVHPSHRRWTEFECLPRPNELLVSRTTTGSADNLITANSEILRVEGKECGTYEQVWEDVREFCANDLDPGMLLSVLADTFSFKLERFGTTEKLNAILDLRYLLTTYGDQLAYDSADEIISRLISETDDFRDGRQKIDDETITRLVNADVDLRWRPTAVDFGYALTCHRAQGSEFDAVCCPAYVGGPFQSIRHKWVYTAITRAKNKLYLQA